MEPTLYRVELTREDGARLHVGELVSRGDRCAFRYDDAYRDNPLSFSLDPINLGLEAKTDQQANAALFGVFEDSLPDGWGRSLISKTLNLSHAEQSPHLLLQYLDHNAIGALSYDMVGGNALLTPFTETISSLEELSAAARAFERGELQDNVMLQRLFRSAGSTGGAHPKVTVADSNNKLKMVKLPSIRDIYDTIGLEASCLELARMVGMKVPEFAVLEAGNTKMLCLDRFDRTNQGCRHMISMQSLLNVTGFYYSSYVQMADIIRRVSAAPLGDLHALYRQMIFNALIGNTDDHLKNFSMYYCQDGYYLTPAYDLLPDVNQRASHTLSFNNNDVGPRRSEAIGVLAHRFKISPQTAKAIVDETVEVVTTSWNAYSDDAGHPNQSMPATL